MCPAFVHVTHGSFFSSCIARSLTSLGSLCRRWRTIGEWILDLRLTGWGMLCVVFEPVEILVAFAARVAAVGLVLLHANCARIWFVGFGIDDAEGSVGVCVERLAVVAMLCDRWVSGMAQCGNNVERDNRGNLRLCGI